MTQDQSASRSDEVSRASALRLAKLWLSGAATKAEDLQIAKALIEIESELASARSERPLIPEGWKLVPVQPTSAMIAAARMSRPYREDDGDEEPMDTNSAATWETMVAAAPSNERPDSELRAAPHTAKGA